MQHRSLGSTGIQLSALGYGSFKIGRNQKVKYPQPYDLPDDATAERLLNSLLDLGITYFDTAPAYGIAEERIGRFLSHRRHAFVLSTKVGEIFENGESTYDFSADSVRTSVERSLKRLRTDVLDVVFIHANADDVQILNDTDVVATLTKMRDQGMTRHIGLSGKTVAAARQALAWSDAIMVEYHLNDRSHEEVIAEAGAKGIGVIVKKGLAAGHLPPRESIEFVLGNKHVTSLIVGGLNLEHMRDNIAAAAEG